MARLETGAEHGMWSFERYAAWMTKRAQWHIPGSDDQAPDQEEAIATGESLPASPMPPSLPRLPSVIGSPPTGTARSGGPIEIEPVEGGMAEIIKRLT